MNDENTLEIKIRKPEEKPKSESMGWFWPLVVLSVVISLIIGGPQGDRGDRRGYNNDNSSGTYRR